MYAYKVKEKIELVGSSNPQLIGATIVPNPKELINSEEIACISDPEERFTTSGVSWEIYEALLVKLSENVHYHINYLDGILEIASPSFSHEKLKKHTVQIR
ncbi:hypothetical protein NUACC21_31630 [Scytonema sp. NUACC21]